MANVTNSYETIMVFSTQSGEENVKALYARFRGLIAENGTVDVEEDWGKRRLAYPIMDELEGYYYLLRFTSEADFPAELDRVYKITDGVLRTIIVRYTAKEQAKPAKVEKEAPVQAEEPAQAETAPAESAQTDAAAE